MAAFPRRLNAPGKQLVGVVINGAEALSQTQPGLQEMMVNYVKEQLIRLFKTTSVKRTAPWATERLSELEAMAVPLADVPALMPAFVHAPVTAFRTGSGTEERCVLSYRSSHRKVSLPRGVVPIRSFDANDLVTTASDDEIDFFVHGGFWRRWNRGARANKHRVN